MTSDYCSNGWVVRSDGSYCKCKNCARLRPPEEAAKIAVPATARTCHYCSWPDDHHNPACPENDGGAAGPEYLTAAQILRRTPQMVRRQPEIDATLHDRGKTYGNFQAQSRIALRIKEAMADSPNWRQLAPDQRETLDMVAVKIARILNGDPNFHDSWHDIVGYTKLVADRLTPPN